MLKIVIDTNVIVSSILSDGVPSKIIEKLIVERFAEVCLSAEVFDEYKDVFGRKKFMKNQNFRQESDIILQYLEYYGKFYHPRFKVFKLSDLSDNKFLELAEEANADYLITGNIRDFYIKNTKLRK